MLSVLFGLTVLSCGVVKGWAEDGSYNQWPSYKSTDQQWPTYKPTNKPTQDHWPTYKPTPDQHWPSMKPTMKPNTPYPPQTMVDKAISVVLPNEDELFPEDSDYPNKQIIYRSEVRGTVTFEQSASAFKTRIYGEITGLPKLRKFGFHVHELGDISQNCLSTGAHYNPFNMNHGGPDSKVRHVGDLGNIYSDKYGVAQFEIFDEMIQLNGDISVIGRAVVIHEDPDDLQPDTPTGNAGGRLACGVIGIAKESIIPYNTAPLYRLT